MACPKCLALGEELCELGGDENPTLCELGPAYEAGAMGGDTFLERILEAAGDDLFLEASARLEARGVLSRVDPDPCLEGFGAYEAFALN